MKSYNKEKLILFHLSKKKINEFQKNMEEEGKKFLNPFNISFLSNKLERN